MELVKDYKSESEFSSSEETQSKKEKDKKTESPQKEIINASSNNLKQIQNLLGANSQIVAIRKRYFSSYFLIFTDPKKTKNI